MGILGLFKPERERREALPDSLPRSPEGDTEDLVPVLALTKDMLLTKDGSFVIMLEIPALEIGFPGRGLEGWSSRFQFALERLPPGTSFQMTMQMHPHDPVEDLRYFLERTGTSVPPDFGEPVQSSNNHQTISLSNSAKLMGLSLAEWFDRTNPLSCRSILTLSHRPSLLDAKPHFPFSKNGRSKGLEDMLRLAPESREILIARVGILTSAFNLAGIPVRRLSIGEMCQAIWHALHPPAVPCPDRKARDLAAAISDGREPFLRGPPPKGVFDPNLPPKKIASLLSPSTVLEDATWIEVDGVKLTGYVVHDFIANRPVMMHRLMGLEGGWSGSMHVEVTDPATVAGKLRQREVQLSALEYAKRSKGLLPNFAAQQEVNALQEQRMHMETTGQSPLYIQLFVMRTAADEATLIHRGRELESLFVTMGVDAFPARYSQLPLWNSTLPVASLAMNQKPRNMTPASMGSFFWPQHKRFMDLDGIYMGIDEATGLPLRIDLFGSHADKTPSCLILGRPGAGKSVTMRALQISALLAGASVMAVDLEGEMRHLCEQYGGRYVEVGSIIGERINILDIPAEGADPLLIGTEHFIGFCEAIRGRPIPKGAEWNTLAGAYRRIVEGNYADSASTIGKVARSTSCEAEPLLEDIVDALDLGTSPASETLAEMLRPYAQGIYAGYFNTPTTFDITEERLVVFGMQHVNDSSEQLRVYLWQVMGLIWGEVLRRHAANPETAQHVMLDEAWRLLEIPGAGSAVENMARRFRKRRAALWLATQEVGEFLDTPTGKRILSVMGNTFLMEQRSVEARRLVEAMNLEAEVARSLQRLGTGRGLLITSRRTVQLWVAVPEAWRAF